MSLQCARLSLWRVLALPAAAAAVNGIFLSPPVATSRPTRVPWPILSVAHLILETLPCRRHSGCRAFEGGTQASTEDVRGPSPQAKGSLTASRVQRGCGHACQHVPQMLVRTQGQQHISKHPSPLTHRHMRNGACERKAGRERARRKAARQYVLAYKTSGITATGTTVRAHVAGDREPGADCHPGMLAVHTRCPVPNLPLLLSPFVPLCPSPLPT